MFRPAVEPERPGLYRADPEQAGRCPGVCCETCPYFVLICGLDGVQGLLAVTNRAAEDKEAIVDEPVHECRVLIPAVLIPDLARGIPAWAVNQSYDCWVPGCEDGAGSPTACGRHPARCLAGMATAVAREPAL